MLNQKLQAEQQKVKEIEEKYRNEAKDREKNNALQD